MKSLKIAKLDPDAYLPTRNHPTDAGLDLYANRSIIIESHSFAIVSTGITIEIEDGFVGLLKPKGRSNHLLGAGVVDAGYQGEILVKVVNINPTPLVVNPGDAIGQLLILPIFTPEVIETQAEKIHMEDSSRGESGGIVDQHKK